MKLKNCIKSLRFENGQISQEELATGVKVSRQTINAIENGRFNPSITLALQIAKYFNKKVDDIFSLEVK